MKKKEEDVMGNHPLVPMILEEINQGRNIFITGGGGVGKSTLTKALLKKFTSPLPLATTNLAAFHIKGGTIHKAFKLYNCKSIKEAHARDDVYINSMMSRDGIDRYVAEARFFKKVKDDVLSADVIFIDEISMLSAQIFDVFIYRLRSFIGDAKIPILVVGDLFQLPPVKSKETKKADMVFKSKHWNFKIIELTTMKRTADSNFISVQSDVRQGYYTDRVQKFIKEHSVDEEPDISIMRLFPKRDQVAHHNRKMLRLLKGDEKKFYASTNNIGNIHKSQIEEFLEEMSAERTLKLKIGAKVIFIATKEENGEIIYYNGQAGIISAIFDDIIRVKINSKDGKSRTILVDKVVFSKIAYKRKKGKLKAETELEVTQFPLKVSYAITIHKTQGMTLTEPIFIDCHKIFEDSQFYVALSRAIEPKNVLIDGFNKSIIRVRKGIRAFYKEQEDLGNLVKVSDY